MKKENGAICCLIIMLIAFNTIIFGQEQQIIKKHYDKVIIKDTLLNNIQFYQLSLVDNIFTTQNTGLPALPVDNTIVRAPKGSVVTMSYKVLSADTIYLDDKKVMPKQHSIIKTNDNKGFDYQKSFYDKDNFYPNEVCNLSFKGIMRDNNINTLSISPIQYNPKRNIVILNKDVEIQINYITNTNIDTKALNGSAITKDNSPYNLVILTNNNFLTTLQPYISWKQKQGYKVQILLTDQIGVSTQNIKAALRNIYLSANSFDYLLIVGDVNAVPCFSGQQMMPGYENHATDLYYAEFTNDIFPDVFYGRISCADTHTLRNILDKTLTYEQYKFANAPDYLDNSLFVAGYETSSNAPTLTNGQMNYLKTYFSSLTDTVVYYNPSSRNHAPDIRSHINQGQGWVVYSAHGLEEGWYMPALRVTDTISNLITNGKYGVYINNCCLAGSYDKSACFTKALLQAYNKGAIGAIGASNVTLWDEDYYWSVGAKNGTLNPLFDTQKLGLYDRLFNTHNLADTQVYNTLSQMIAAGNLAVTQSLSDYAEYYWEVYNLQGDPTLMPYVGKPNMFNVDLPQTITTNMDSLVFSAPKGTYACLSNDTNILAVAWADDNDRVNLSLNRVNQSTNAYLVLTNQFYAPLIDTITISNAPCPFVAIKDISIINNNDNSEAVFLKKGNTYNVNLSLINSGNQNISTQNKYIQVSYNSNQVQFINDTIGFNDINIDQQYTITNAFTFTVDQDIMAEEFTHLLFKIMVNNSQLYSTNITKLIATPILDIHSIAMGQNNDTIKIGVNVVNQGLVVSDIAHLSISEYENDLLCLDSVFVVDTIGSRTSLQYVFGLINNDEDLDTLRFSLHLYNSYTDITNRYAISLKQKVEGFENDLSSSAFAWQNVPDYPWQRDNNSAYSGNYSLRSNTQLPDDNVSYIYFDVNLPISANISFAWKVSSENDYDVFNFIVDHNFVLEESGEKDWQNASFDLLPGNHTLMWAYQKDQSYHSGQDAAWIDDIKLTFGIDSLQCSLSDLVHNKIIIYPIPARDFLNLEIDTDNCNIKIIDLQGKVVLFRQLKECKSNVNLNSLVSGVYYIVIEKGNKPLGTKKLIITK